MATKKKMLQAAAGNAGGAGLNVEDVFSTYLYDGNDSTQTITNGIDLSGEGGLVWIKSRSSEDNHALQDTERGADYWLLSNSTLVQQNNEINFAFNSDGFSQNNTFGITNNSDYSYASWTFRKAPKFFDVVTYTGTGSAQSISHDLGTTVGTLIVKRTDDADSWRVYHREMDATAPQNYYMNLDGTDASAAASTVWNNTAPTDTTFTVGTSGSVNASGGTYVAYLFAHNDGDGEFGPDGDADIIKCGSFTTDSNSRATVDLGFEPQFVIFKPTSTSGSWEMDDVMRGWGETQREFLMANISNAEASGDNVTYPIKPTSTGFLYDLSVAGSSYAGLTYIYIAIRRGTKVPESATEVFDVNTWVGDGAASRLIATSTDVTDFVIARDQYDTSARSIVAYDRLRGNGISLRTTASNAEAVPPSANYDLSFDTNGGFLVHSAVWGAYLNYSSYNILGYSFRRAPKFFDVVAYTGDGVAGRTVSHNLGVAPEMMWVKCRDSAIGWQVYHAALGNTGGLSLNITTNPSPVNWWNNTDPSSTSFSLGSSTGNNTGLTFIAYLFASLAGVSKVGSYTGNGSSQTIDCGFTSGARFVLIKRTDSTGDWYVWDTERGIVTGNDPHLSLNTTVAEVTTDDSIDPDSSGFIVNQVAATNINVSSAEYIFYAVA